MEHYWYGAWDKWGRLDEVPKGEGVTAQAIWIQQEIIDWEGNRVIIDDILVEAHGWRHSRHEAATVDLLMQKTLSNGHACQGATCHSHS